MSDSAKKLLIGAAIEPRAGRRSVVKSAAIASATTFGLAFKIQPFTLAALAGLDARPFAVASAAVAPEWPW
jgi:hypothetical protein